MSYQLILRSADIPSYNAGALLPKYNVNNYPTERIEPYEDNYYKINTFQSDITFKGIYLNLRSILSTLPTDFDKDQFYKLRVNNISFGMSSDGQPLSADERERCFNIELSGLNFLSSTQNGSYYSDKIILATVRIASGSTLSTFSYINRDIAFMIRSIDSNYRPDITIRYLDIETNQLLPNDLTSIYPNIQLNLSFSKF